MGIRVGDTQKDPIAELTLKPVELTKEIQPIFAIPDFLEKVKADYEKYAERIREHYKSPERLRRYTSKEIEENCTEQIDELKENYSVMEKAFKSGEWNYDNERYISGRYRSNFSSAGYHRLNSIWPFIRILYHMMIRSQSILRTTNNCGCLPNLSYQAIKMVVRVDGTTQPGHTMH